VPHHNASFKLDTESKVDVLLRYVSITLLSVFICFTLPQMALEQYSARHNVPVQYNETLESETTHYLRTYPNKQTYIEYVKTYRVNDAENIVDNVLLHARYHHLDPKLLFAIAASESSFNVHAKSYVGAIGILQVMPFWKKELGNEKADLTSLSTNLDFGATILKIYIEKEDNNLVAALARYNGTAGKMKYPMKIMSQAVWLF